MSTAEREATSPGNAVGNRLEPGIRNGSQPCPGAKAGVDSAATGTAPRRGRRPVLDDQALDAAARGLRQDLGRMPTVDELVVTAGGCQRKRAVEALRGIRLEQARNQMSQELRLPSPIETALRELMARWLGLAADQLAERAAESMLDLEQARNRMQSEIEEYRLAHRDLRDRIRQLEGQISEQQAQLSSLGRLSETWRAERDAARITAEERGRLLERWLGGLPDRKASRADAG